MSRLLRADLARLWKTKSFWVCLIGSFGFAAVITVSSYLDDKEVAERLGNMALTCNSFVLFFTSVFTALFLGTDYSNGTVRNKLTVGGKRGGIYLSDFITVSAGALLCFLATRAAVWSIGLAVGGGLGIPAEGYMLAELAGVCAVTAMSALFTLIGMLVTAKSITAVLSIVITFAMTAAAGTITGVLKTPETSVNYGLAENGEVVVGEAEPNPYYVSGVKRVILTAVNDILPAGQLFQTAVGEPHNVGLMPVYALGVTAVSTAIGTLVFRRKDLR